ncbi:hypothetical protein [Paraburkholderia sp. J11-2]|uniref:hypothetical protein n=1 Tax=Paraburkholderia sp. J11-2 TaxID=2805431 RepID=UPI002AB68B63|nr:hypothetical protein [Paraburkholderia sp. J11-2]
MTHLDKFSDRQRAALDLLRETVRRYATAQSFDAIHVSDPHALARGLAEARTIVASDPHLLREAGRQMFTQFDLAPPSEAKRKSVLAMYHSDAELSQWTVLALKWVAQLAMAMADRKPPTMQ